MYPYKPIAIAMKEAHRLCIYITAKLHELLEILSA